MNLGTRPYELQASAFQTAILLLYNAATSFTVEELQQRTSITVPELQKVLKVRARSWHLRRCGPWHGWVKRLAGLVGHGRFHRF